MAIFILVGLGKMGEEASLFISGEQGTRGVVLECDHAFIM